MKRTIAGLRRISIKKRLGTLFHIQLIMMIALFLLAFYSVFSTMSSQVRLSGQQLLYTASSRMSDTCAELISLTRYPALASGHGSTMIYDYLSEGSVFSHSPDEQLSMQRELNNQLMLHSNVTLLGIADLQGGIIYASTKDDYYKLKKYNAGSPLAAKLLEFRGGYRIMTAAQISDLLPSFDPTEECLYSGRAIMKLNHLESVGIVLCRMDISGIRSAFELNRLYPEQSLALYDMNGELLYGEKMDGVAARDSGRMESAWRKGRDGFSLYQVYRTDSGVTAVLKTPLVCFARRVGFLFFSAVLVLLMVEAMILFLSHRLVRSIREPIDKLMGVADRVRGQDFSPLEDEGACDEMHDLIESFNTMSASIRNLIEVVYEKNLLQAQTEMQLVRSQMNPHFVYNTLEIIRAAAYSRRETDIADMAVLLGKTLRYGVTREGDSVTVEQELFHLRDYIALQQMHLHNRLEVYINVDPAMYSACILRLVLQPLVENAIYHGMQDSAGKGVVRIMGYREEGDILFSVSDDGAGIPEELLTRIRGYIEGENDDFSSIGLRNTHRRLLLRYGRPYGLSLRSTPGRGTVATVRMPFRAEPFHEDDKEADHDSDPDCG